MKKIRRQNQGNENKPLHHDSKKGISENSTARLDEDLLAENREDDKEMLNRAVEEELRDVGLVMDEELNENEWIDANDFMEDEGDGNTLTKDVGNMYLCVDKG